MSLIDQRILVVAPVEAVWLYLTDPAYVSKWNRGAKSISTLTTRLTGVGMRRRCVDTRGRAVVEEMTAWLENIGYEYIIIDGPYRTFKGRVRLQPVPEGTIVNWTIEYQLKGVLAGLRDALRRRRGLRVQMADSLRALRRLIEASGVKLDPVRQAKVAMQADPGIEARMARVNESTRASAAITTAPAVSIFGADDVPDLPERPVEQPTSIPTSIPTHVPLPVNTQTIVASALKADTIKDDTKPRAPKGLREAIDKTSEAEKLAQSLSPTVPAAMVAPPRPPDPPTQTLPVMANVTLAPQNTSVARPPNLPEVKAVPSVELPEPPIPTAPSVPPPPYEKLDTGEMSIWDIFGLEPPSQRNKAELDAVIASLQTPPPRPASAINALQGDNPHRPVKATVKVRRLKTHIRSKTAVKVRPYHQRG